MGSATSTTLRNGSTVREMAPCSILRPATSMSPAKAESRSTWASQLRRIPGTRAWESPTSTTIRLSSAPVMDAASTSACSVLPSAMWSRRIFRSWPTSRSVARAGTPATHSTCPTPPTPTFLALANRRTPPARWRTIFRRRQTAHGQIPITEQLPGTGGATIGGSVSVKARPFTERLPTLDAWNIAVQRSH